MTFAGTSANGQDAPRLVVQSRVVGLPLPHPKRTFARLVKLRPPEPTRSESGARLQDHIKRSFGGPPDEPEPPRLDDLAQLRFAGLGAKRGADFLRQRSRDADHRRRGVIQAADRVQILFEAVA